MLSAVKRYKLLLSGVLARYFPRTVAYLRAEREAALFHQAPAPRANKQGKASAGKTRPAAKQPGARSAKTTKTTKTTKADKADKPRAPARPRGGAGIYGPALLAVEPAQVEAMRARVAEAVAAGVIRAPSDEQWAMILARQPATRIFAGAGSGKSTTLVLRVVFMLCHLGIPAERLAVISFTNASCAELREQLLRVLGFWQYPFNEAQARHCVRTFHSAMAQLARTQLCTPAWFEQLDDRAAATDEPDTPLGGGRLRPAQQRLLKQAYQRCYAEEPGFAERVHALLGLPAPSGKRGRAPLDGLRLAGEFAAVPLFEAFYAQAGFIESIGLRIDQLDAGALDCPERERSFVAALVAFWKHFEAVLEEQGLLTFNGAFQRLTRQLTEGGEGIAGEALAPFAHLLIDEFQDISPQIVQWLQAVHASLARRGEPVSLMAIGDDWQSIYGWRGSSPELFMDFDRHFPGKGKAKASAVLNLSTNYRSIEPVIRDGERVLAAVAVKQAKTSQAARAVQPGDHGVQVVTGFELHSRMPELLAQVRAQCEHAASRQSAERTAVLLLSRRNEPLQQIQRELGRKLPVKALTIHRAKGLQAEVAIIVDDCAAPEPHPLRNALYARSGFFRNSYDQAMQDESLRLAYVAITRGVSRVLWFTRKAQGATRLLGRGAVQTR
ncbi:DEAD/DEAH box helicase [Pseudomonas sp. AN-1]|uniref:DEAD/DEAH box helicase n=1 Tax=Pseudomonas sp. AN-1 TaxID=3096605 RepID=UPI002A6B6548|nr:DEAD/DEAH box helicase [Pseudomonas sp. AN-1]WPP46534.1 DEAD/DEAH box helicase [Pseudomonas sp. AN-1]